MESCPEWQVLRIRNNLCIITGIEAEEAETLSKDITKIFP